MNRLRFNLISGSSSVLLVLSLSCWASTAMAESPSFDCRKVKDSSLKKMICADELAKLHPQTRRRLCRSFQKSSQ